MPNLDLLRTIAILLVIADHLCLGLGVQYWGRWRIADMGVFGVYLFFVHTSLVLMWSLERRPNALDFYIRRAFRIYPLAITVILIAAALHAPVAGVGKGSFVAAPVTARSLLFNCLLIFDNVRNVPVILGTTWSLPPEIYMYVLLPCLFFYARTLRRIWPILMIWALAVFCAQYLIPLDAGNDFLVMIPDFLAGIIAYVGFMRRRAVVPGWAFLPILALLFYFYMAHRHIRSDYISCLALGLVLPSIRQFHAAVPRRIAHRVATYSYGVYLIHPFCMMLGFYWLQNKPLVLQLTAVLVPLFILPVAAFHWIERPMIGLGARLAAKLAHERGLPSQKSLDDLEPAP